MRITVEVFADIGCPFTHVGLKLVAAELAALDTPADCHVRSWPLEWINGQPMQGSAVAEKAEVLTSQLGEDHFGGFGAEAFPVSTIPALNLVASGYAVDAPTGLVVSLEVRRTLFEQGQNVGSESVLASIAARHGLPTPSSEPDQSITDDLDEGRRRGVNGSPHFFAGGEQFFCPTLDLGHDDVGHLTAHVDVDGLHAFIAHVRSL